jgi:hypothetical protein
MKNTNPWLKGSFILATTLFTTVFLTGCTSTDVIGKVAVSSFSTLTTLTETNTAQLGETNYWKISTIDAQGLYLATDSSSKADAVLEIKASPFIEAGLKVDQIKDWQFNAANDTLTLSSDLTSSQYSADASKSASDAFKALIKSNREAIGYHEALDHYGIKLGNGNMFEWAKDDKTNDKDMVLVLNPEPFLTAGVDPTLLKGWIFTKVDVLDDKGNPIKVDKFLSPYELSK